MAALPLQGKVAIVAGGSRGAGAGVARALGSAGATVYVSGRTVRGGPPPRDGAAGTVEDTAEEVTRRGGVGIAAACDHTVDAQVATLFERVQQEQGRLDLLVNAVWGGNELPSLQADWGRPFWEQDEPPAGGWDAMFTTGVRPALIAAHHASRVMAAQKGGLIVNVSFAYPSPAPSPYIGHLLYDLSKVALCRLAFGLSEELRPHGVAALALSPGHMRTERVLRHFDTDEQSWRSVPELAGSETPEYLGRAVAALAADPDVLRRSGQVGGLQATPALPDRTRLSCMPGMSFPCLGWPSADPHCRRAGEGVRLHGCRRHAAPALWPAGVESLPSVMERPAAAIQHRRCIAAHLRGGKAARWQIPLRMAKLCNSGGWQECMGHSRRGRLYRWAGDGEHSCVHRGQLQLHCTASHCTASARQHRGFKTRGPPKRWGVGAGSTWVSGAIAGAAEGCPKDSRLDRDQGIEGPFHAERSHTDCGRGAPAKPLSRQR